MLTTDPVIETLEEEYASLTVYAVALKRKARVLTAIATVITIGFGFEYYSIYQHLDFTNYLHIAILVLGIVSLFLWAVVFNALQATRFTFAAMRSFKESELFRIGDKAWAPEGLPASTSDTPTVFPTM